MVVVVMTLLWRWCETIYVMEGVTVQKNYENGGDDINDDDIDTYGNKNDTDACNVCDTCVYSTHFYVF